MSPRDFFRVVLKILALLVLITGIVPLLFNVFGWYVGELYANFLSIGLILIYVLLIYFIVIKADSIINWLKLDSGYDSDFFTIGKLNDSRLISLAIIIVGLYLCFSSLPVLLQESFILFKSKVAYNLIKSENYNQDYYFYYNIIQFFVGLLIVASRKQISNLFTSKTK